MLDIKIQIMRSRVHSCGVDYLRQGAQNVQNYIDENGEFMEFIDWDNFLDLSLLVFQCFVYFSSIIVC